MRRVTRSCLSLLGLGLALAIPSTTWADPPHLCAACQAQQQAGPQFSSAQPSYGQPSYGQPSYGQASYGQAPYLPYVDAPPTANPPQDTSAPQQGAPQRKGMFSSRKPQKIHVCAKCMQAQQLAAGGMPSGPPMMVAGMPSCPTCGPQAPPPGYAVVGSGPAQGYTVMGGSLEPTPIGVVQANFRQATEPPGRAVVGGQKPGDPSALANSSNDPVNPHAHRHPWILHHLFGVPTPGMMGEEAKERAKAAHAAIPYGPNGQPVSELPASMVYGR